MKLKPGGRIAIFLIIGVIAFFLIKRFLPQNDGSVTLAPANTTASSDGNSKPSDNTAQGTSDDKSGTKNTATTKTASRTFDYVPEKPVNGKLRGVVEVGATGFNSFVINMDNQKDGKLFQKILANHSRMKDLQRPTI